MTEDINNFLVLYIYIYKDFVSVRELYDSFKNTIFIDHGEN